jgi:vacuolar-type H+-ATPase subunit E/Vma4
MNNKTATATMQTPDGKIKGTVKWNDYWKTFQVTVDGVISGEFDDFDEGVDELKRTGFKNVQINENTVNLKENYERLFGKMIVENKLGQRIKTPVANSLTEKEQLRFSNIQKSFQHQYPNKQLRLREGFVIVDNMIVERMETFFKKNNAQISLTLKQYI